MILFNSILVVCLGNICRSPVGERMLRASLPDRRIDSAGLAACVAQAACPIAASVAAGHGLSLAGHSARAFSSDLARPYELILVMEKSQLGTINTHYPEFSGKTLLFGHWQNQLEIGDPYKKSREMHEQVYMQLSLCTRQWVSALKP